MVDNMDNQEQAQNPSSEMVLPPPIPWYQKIVRTPRLKRNIALSLGIVLLAITGYIIFRAVRERQGAPTRVGTRTTPSEANATGIINLSLALDPAQRASPPTGTFQLATIPLSPNTAAQNISATLHLDTPAMQVVNPDTPLFTITTVDSTITLNVTPPTPTPTT